MKKKKTRNITYITRVWGNPTYSFVSVIPTPIAEVLSLNKNKREKIRWFFNARKNLVEVTREEWRKVHDRRKT